MFDLQPPRHISTLRNLAVTVRSGEGPLTEPTAAAQPWRQEPALMPLSGHCLEPVAGSKWRWEAIIGFLYWSAEAWQIQIFIADAIANTVVGYASSALSSAFASLRSCVSNPSVNQP